MRYHATRYIPKNSLPIEEEGLGVVYVYPTTTPRSGICYGIVAYREKAIHSDFHIACKTDADVDKKIAAFFDGIRQHKQLVADRRTKDFAGHTFNVGDIVTNSWGYDQTNVDWYAVTRTTKNYVWLRPICAEVEQTGFMSGTESPRLDENLKPILAERGLETKHRASGSHVTMRHGCGSKWTCDKKYSSWYA